VAGDSPSLGGGPRKHGAEAQQVLLLGVRVHDTAASSC